MDPPALPLFKNKDEKDIAAPGHRSPPCYHERQTGRAKGSYWIFIFTAARDKRRGAVKYGDYVFLVFCFEARRNVK